MTAKWLWCEMTMMRNVQWRGRNDYDEKWQWCEMSGNQIYIYTATDQMEKSLYCRSTPPSFRYHILSPIPNDGNKKISPRPGYKRLKKLFPTPIKNIKNSYNFQGLPNPMPERPGLPSFYFELPKVVYLCLYTKSSSSLKGIQVTKHNKDLSTPEFS